MTSSPDQQKISERLEVIASQVARYENKINLLREEERELLIAQTVLLRLSGSGKTLESNDNMGSTRKLEGSINRVKQVRAKGGERPSGIPSTPIMIKRSILDDINEGGNGLTNRGLVARIEAKWWPGVDPNLIIPTAWRMVKSGNIHKIGDKYSLSQTDRENKEFGKELLL